MEEEAQSGQASLIKYLASCNTITRNKSLKIITNTWLPSQRQVSDDNMKKLWKGLFYCLWHADKVQAQSDLINRLSSLIFKLDLPLSLHYLSTFFLTMRREWPGIDHLRLDKFYLLIRQFIRCLFSLMKKNKWDLDILKQLMGILEKRAFLADDKFLGNGVNYHVVSVFLDELKAFLPVTPQVFDVLFKPFLDVLYVCQDKVLVGKVRSCVFDVLLRMGRDLLERKKLGVDGGDEDDETVVFGTIVLKMGFSVKFYELGSSPDCLQGNRKVLFGLHEEFLKMEREMELSGIEISFPDVKVDDDDDNVPMLIHIDGTEIENSASVALEVAEAVPEDMNDFVRNPLKNSKKGKKGSEGSNKKAKTKKKKKKKKNVISENSFIVEGNGDVKIANGDNLANGLSSDENLVILNESVISNLQMQFEKIAAEVGSDKNDTSSFDSPIITTKRTKKRKRAKSVDVQDFFNPDLSGQGDGDAAKSADKSAKKVSFAMKNNLVWKPHSPLPPQSLRLPPSLTPRGSALKKGIPPGPIREMPPATKKMKQKKKGRKVIKAIPPAIKRLRKLRAVSI